MKTTEKLNNQQGTRTVAAHLEMHEVAHLFPMTTGYQQASLMEDIRKNGQRVPISTYKGKIIDGRSRYWVCQYLGLLPKVQEWHGKGSLVQFVFTANNQTHHLTSSQRAVVAVDAMDMLEAEAAERRRRGGGKGGRRAAQSKRGQQQEGTPAAAESSGLAADLDAFLAGVNPQYFDDAKTLKAENPEFFKEVRYGAWTIGRVMSWHRQKKAYDACNEPAKAEGFPSKWDQTRAWHEAGHAVVAYVLGHEVVRVTIEPDDPSKGGACVYRRGPKQADKAEWIRADILSSLAGEEAEAKWGGTAWTKIARQGAANDLKSVRGLQPRAVATASPIGDGAGGEGGLVLWSRETRRRHLEWLRSETRDILSSPGVWEAVQAVVAALLKKKTLGGGEVQAIIGQHTGQMQLWEW